MSCLFCHRALLTDPRHLAPEVQRHLQECPDCQSFYREIQSLDQALLAALQISVPDDLQGRLLLLNQTAPTRRAPPRWYALAAVITAALITGWLWFKTPHYQVMDQALLQHMWHEPNAMQAKNTVPTSDINRNLARVGAQLQGSVEINYNMDCEVNGEAVAHMVVQGKQGPVTLILLRHSMAQHQFANADFSGVILPTQGGSMALIAKPGEDLNALGKQLQPHFIWPAAQT